jgi:hypothetical protein
MTGERAKPRQFAIGEIQIKSGKSEAPRKSPLNLAASNVLDWRCAPASTGAQTLHADPA